MATTRLLYGYYLAVILVKYGYQLPMVINNISTIITIFTVLIMVTNGYHWLLLVVNICYNMAIGCKKWLPTIVWPIEW